MKVRKPRRAESSFELQSLERRRLLSAAFLGGYDNDIAYDPASDKTWMAYFDDDTNSLKVTSKPDGGSWAAPTQLDAPTSGGEVGRYISLAIAPSGNVGISYYHAENADLRFVEYNATTQQWGTPETPDSLNVVGLYTSLTYNSNSRPYISYFKDGATSDQLRVVYKTTAWVAPSIVDSGTDVGRYSSIGIRPGIGKWAISYVAGLDFRYAQDGQANATIDAGGGGSYTSLAFDGNNDPWFSYYRSGSTALKLAKKIGTNPWSTETVFGNQGYYTNLFLEGTSTNPDPRVVFYDPNANTVVSRKKTSGTWQTATVFKGGGSQVAATKGADGKLNYTLVTTTFNGNVGGNPTYFRALQERHEDDGTFGDSWSSVTQTGLPERSDFGAAVFQGKMWVFGGLNDLAQSTADLYSSSTGPTWSLETRTGDTISARKDAPLVVSADGTQMWIIGGEGNDDVFVTTDGTQWTLVADNLSFLSGRAMFSAVYFDNALWVLGGRTSSTWTNDVYKSTDGGETWAQVQPGTGDTPFSVRDNFAAYVFSNRMWVLGGQTNGNGAITKTVYHSVDGENWVKVSDYPFTERKDLGAVLFDNRMWVVGGNSFGTADDDVWYTVDGEKWIEMADPGGFSTRMQHGLLSFSNRLWVIAGYAGGSLSDTIYQSESL